MAGVPISDESDRSDNSDRSDAAPNGWLAGVARCGGWLWWLAVVASCGVRLVRLV
ncbi:hypothetical protein [uncultured Porphyromonas sp.]|uniref:hypothetical protein n=1 Tax=uncultured Porphyromonas sp. TaxID=159274 RepID=UPI00258658AA|nr:hypothetical protein [uncultured Porphyromonas sp.]